jgi:hypothetical protein
MQGQDDESSKNIKKSRNSGVLLAAPAKSFAENQNL